MSNYVAGFLFDKNREYVAMVVKKKPDWQKDHLNAIGGKICTMETPTQAMEREFLEEVELSVKDWKRFCILRGRSRTDEYGVFTVHFFKAFGNPFQCRRVNDVGEQIVILPIENLMAHLDRELHPRPKMISNIPWLIQMALAIENDVASELVISEAYRDA